MNKDEKKLFEHVRFLYGDDQVQAIFKKIQALLEKFKKDHTAFVRIKSSEKISERDVILITYGDIVRENSEQPLETLGRLLIKYLVNEISTVHILPFFPFSSDDGFSIIDYRKVNPDFGSWDDVSKINQHFQLMFDAVINHCSTQSDIFQGFLNGDPDKRDYFTVVDSDADLSQVFRPRATPVVTRFTTNKGEKLVWTTFSSDQVDLNFRNPAVLLEMIDILLFYVQHGAEFIRLDAVTYVWKEWGTNCINLPQTHRFVQLIRTVLDVVAPNVVIVTETNVPHKDNIAYFGDGTNEAQMVYNFALPFLVLHCFLSEDTKYLTTWADTLDLPSNQTTFLNFLACHDGIGMLPIKDILPVDEVEKVVQHVAARGGFISYKSNGDGTKSPYELNVNYLDAIHPLYDSEINKDIAVNRFLAAHAIMFALRGIPGIYFHSMFGSRNWAKGVEESGRYRTINRQKLNFNDLSADLANSNSIRRPIYEGLMRLLKVRREEAAFHPFGDQKIFHLHPSVFSLLRVSPDQTSRMLCLHNVGNQSVDSTVDLGAIGLDNISSLQSTLTSSILSTQNGSLKFNLDPYEILWLKTK